MYKYIQYRHPLALAGHWQSHFRSCMYILLFQLTRHFFTPPWLCHQSLSPPPMLMTSHSDWSMTGLRNLPGISHHSYTAGPAQLSEISKDRIHKLTPTWSAHCSRRRVRGWWCRGCLDAALPELDHGDVRLHHRRAQAPRHHRHPDCRRDSRHGGRAPLVSDNSDNQLMLKQQ